MKVNAPTFRPKLERDLKLLPGDPVGFARPADQGHPRLDRSAAPFALVAVLATGHNVVPALGALLNHRDHVIQRQVCSSKFFAAILALVMVSQKHILPRKPDHLLFLFQWNVLEQSQDSGDFDRNSNASNFSIAFFDDFHFALK